MRLTGLVTSALALTATAFSGQNVAPQLPPKNRESLIPTPAYPPINEAVCSAAQFQVLGISLTGETGSKALRFRNIGSIADIPKESVITVGADYCNKYDSLKLVHRNGDSIDACSELSKLKTSAVEVRIN